MLIGVPGKGYPAGIGLFGKYPLFTVYPGDTFYTTIACQGDADCNLEFALEYYDQWGNYQPTSWKWDHLAGDGPQELAVDLSSLAGQSVEFSLVLRQEDQMSEQWAKWFKGQSALSAITRRVCPSRRTILPSLISSFG